MAAALGMKVGKPLHIDVNDWGGGTSWQRGSWGYYGGGQGGGASQNAIQSLGSGEGGDTFSVGQISISANVSVSFLIE